MLCSIYCSAYIVCTVSFIVSNCLWSLLSGELWHAFFCLVCRLLDHLKKPHLLPVFYCGMCSLSYWYPGYCIHCFPLVAGTNNVMIGHVLTSSLLTCTDGTVSNLDIQLICCYIFYTVTCAVYECCVHVHVYHDEIVWGFRFQCRHWS